MANLKLNGETFEVADGVRLVQAVKDSGVNIGHRCGGYAKCTTCRVTFNEGEPDVMTKAEFEKLGDDLGEFRLACQIVCSGEMDVNVLMTKESAGWDDSGPAVEAAMTPDSATFPISELKG